MTPEISAAADPGENGARESTIRTDRRGPKLRSNSAQRSPDFGPKRKSGILGDICGGDRRVGFRDPAQLSGDGVGGAERGMVWGGQEFSAARFREWRRKSFPRGEWRRKSFQRGEWRRKPFPREIVSARRDAVQTASAPSGALGWLCGSEPTLESRPRNPPEG